MSHYIPAPEFPMRNANIKLELSGMVDTDRAGETKNHTMEFDLLALLAFFSSFYNVLAFSGKGNQCMC